MSRQGILGMQDKIHIYLFIVAVVLCVAAYMQSYGAGWTFDDTRILQGLSGVDSFSSFLDFILNGFKGSVTSRPISLASFVINRPDWPLHPFGFRQINIGLHVFNAFLLALVSFRVARMIPGLASRAVGFAVSLGVIWMLHPFLASTSFHVIQRMVILAASFSLLGVLLYLKGRSLLAERPLLGYGWMSGGMILAGGIGFFAKENAALTPLMVAVLEMTILSRYSPVTDRYFRKWKLFFFVLPALLLLLYSVYYLVAHVPDGYALRRFTLLERLLSEPVILLEYVKQILLPDIMQMGPYQDDLARIRGVDGVSVSAVLLWIVLVITAFLKRAAFPALSFAVLFFLTGHLLESTIFNLELYFEHRNYLPGIGLLAGILGYLWSRKRPWPGYAGYVYAGVMGLLLWQVNSLWGDPFKSAHVWASEHPTSPRAMQGLPTLYQRLGQFDRAAQIIVSNYKRDPMDGGLATFALISKCFKKDKNTLGEEIKQIISDSSRLFFSFTTVKTLHNMIDLHLKGKCESFVPQEVAGVARGLLDNPAYQSPYQQYGLYFVLARAQELAGDRKSGIDTKLKAYRVQPALVAAKTIYFELSATGRHAEAEQFLKEARSEQPEYVADYDSWRSEVQR